MYNCTTTNKYSKSFAPYQHLQFKTTVTVVYVLIRYPENLMKDFIK